MCVSSRRQWTMYVTSCSWVTGCRADGNVCVCVYTVYILLDAKTLCDIHVNCLELMRANNWVGYVLWGMIHIHSKWNQMKREEKRRHENREKCTEKMQKEWREWMLRQQRFVYPCWLVYYIFPFNFLRGTCCGPIANAAHRRNGIEIFAAAAAARIFFFRCYHPTNARHWHTKLWAEINANIYPPIVASFERFLFRSDANPIMKSSCSSWESFQI